jgi:hypothetical protein
MKRLRIFVLNTPLFWLTVFYQRAYGKPRLTIELWEPHKWKRFWINLWQWEPVPDTRGSYAPSRDQPAQKPAA